LENERDAVVCLRSWKVMCGRPAFFKRGANERLRMFEGLI